MELPRRNFLNLSLRCLELIVIGKLPIIHQAATAQSPKSKKGKYLVNRGREAESPEYIKKQGLIRVKVESEEVVTLFGLDNEVSREEIEKLLAEQGELSKQIETDDYRPERFQLAKEDDATELMQSMEDLRPEEEETVQRGITYFTEKGFTAKTYVAFLWTELTSEGKVKKIEGSVGAGDGNPDPPEGLSSLSPWNRPACRVLNEEGEDPTIVFDNFFNGGNSFFSDIDKTSSAVYQRIEDLRRESDGLVRLGNWCEDHSVFYYHLMGNQEEIVRASSRLRLAASMSEGRTVEELVDPNMEMYNVKEVLIGYKDGSHTSVLSRIESASLR